MRQPPLSQYQVRQAVSLLLSQAASIIFIEKRTSFPRACIGDKPRCLIRACTKRRHFGARPTSSVKREMQAACRLCDLSVGYAMFFSRRWMPCCLQHFLCTACLICCCSSMRNTRCSTASNEFLKQPARTFFLTHKASKKG